MTAKAKTLVLFDFDGTLTTKDSLFGFLLHSVGLYQYLLNILLNIPNFILLALGLRKNDAAKQRLLATFFLGWESDTLYEVGKSYSIEKIPNIARKKGVEKINQHLQLGHRVILVSASLELWLAPWCQQQGIELLATKLEKKDGLITGRFDGENCYGQQKVERLKSYLNINDYDQIHAYGDSAGDTEMLALAQFKYYKPFR